jgi:sugar/nucleoside kinase (ribokinase family)
MSSKIVVAGVTSLYTAVGIGEFPVRYEPTSSPAWIRTGVGGAGGHIASALAALGDDVELCTVTGDDLAGDAIRAHLRDNGLLGDGVIEGAASSLGVVLVAQDGSRMGYPYLAAVNTIDYPADVFDDCSRGADLAVMTNARFVQPLLHQASRLGVPVAVDVHLISDPDDARNRPWLEVADIVFCSHERLSCPPVEWVRQVFDRYPGCSVAGVGRGPDGCLLGLRDGTLAEIGAIAPRGVVSTAGAGDALFASFLHSWVATGNPVDALESAVLYAGWKIGDGTPGSTLLSEADLAGLRAAHPIHAAVSRWRGPALSSVRRRSGAADGRGAAWPGQRRAG